MSESRQLSADLAISILSVINQHTLISDGHRTLRIGDVRKALVYVSAAMIEGHPDLVSDQMMCEVAAEFGKAIAKSATLMRRNFNETGERIWPAKVSLQ
jgi:hypothetical protein